MKQYRKSRTKSQNRTTPRKRSKSRNKRGGAETSEYYKSGYGRCKWNDYLYEGYFNKNTPNGEGKLYITDLPWLQMQAYLDINKELPDENVKLYYKGHFVNGIMMGSGIIFFENGQKLHEGEFGNNMLNGKCITYGLKCGNIIYYGYCRDGQKHGKGIDYAEKDDIDDDDIVLYEGEFKNNQRDGKGIEYSPDGTRYEGYFKNDQRDGMGTEYYPDGNQIMFKGKFKDDEWAVGIKYDFDGKKIYEGQYLNGGPHGKGIAYDEKENIIYEGDYLQNRKHGKGISYSDGEKEYEGDFWDDKPCGKGIIYYYGRKEYEGEVKDGKRHGKGIEYNPRGEKLFEANFINNKPHGKGIIYDGDIILKAYWEHGIQK